MKTQFHIILSLKTRQGFTDYGQYFIGNRREAAHALFGRLKGSDNLQGRALLHIDLLETGNDVPVNVRSKSCTLDELGWNCKQIAREMFRLKNIKEEA